jgi:glycosyltransferase involved in cell wall biosynthesis
MRHELSQLPKNIRLFVPGSVDYPTNISHVKECNIGITPTLLESFGMAVIEAISCGVPMVAFDVGGVPEVLKDQENGFLVKYRDVDGLITKARSLLYSPLLLTQMKSRAFATSIDDFNSDRVVEHWVQLIQQPTSL